MKIYFSKDFLVSDDDTIVEIDKFTSAIETETIQDLFDLLKECQNYPYYIEYDKDEDRLWMAEHENYAMEE